MSKDLPFVNNAEKTTLTSTTTNIHHHLSDSLNLSARDSFILNMFAIDKDSERGI